MTISNLTKLSIVVVLSQLLSFCGGVGETSQLANGEQNQAKLNDSQAVDSTSVRYDSRVLTSLKLMDSSIESPEILIGYGRYVNHCEATENQESFNCGKIPSESKVTVYVNNQRISEITTPSHSNSRYELEVFENRVEIK